ncbi:MAG: hypothetical protein ACTSQC_06075 [Candidatus Heimdallarchaeaceae archaeon]
MKPFWNKIYHFFVNPILFIVGLVIFILVLVAKFVFLIYETLIPRGLREIVPHMVLWRKYLLYASNLFAPQEEFDAIEVEEKVHELVSKEDKINKAYPIQRGVGETYDHVLIFALIIIVSIVAIGSATTNFDTFVNSVLEMLGIQGLEWYWYILIGIVFSTVMGMLSTIATIFGPVYAVFHRSSLRMVQMGAYSWGTIYQKLENLFSLPYIASKASFTFFDAPPISEDTFKEFREDVMGEFGKITSRISSILSSSSVSLPVQTRELYKELMSTDLEDRLDMTKITDATSRAFSLLIWQSETAVIPWRKEPGLLGFAKKNNLDYKDARNTFVFITNKLKDDFVSKTFYDSILLTGALKGIINTEKKHTYQMSDLEYSKLAFALAIGTQRYILDHFSKNKLKVRLKTKIKNFLFGFIVPAVELSSIFVSYFKHIGNSIKMNFAKGWSTRFVKFFYERFQEIQTGLRVKVYEDKDEEETELEKGKEKSRNFFISGLLFLLQVVLALPLSLYFFAKLFYLMFREIFRKKKPEEVIKKKFEKEIAKESLITMYDEIYSKLVLDTFYYT